MSTSTKSTKNYIKNIIKLIIVFLCVLIVVFVIKDRIYIPILENWVTVKQDADKLCFAKEKRLPPNSFTTDGCSMWPEYFGKKNWEQCCIAHDQSYWCGGEEDERLNADNLLRTCVNKVAPGFGSLMYVGARIGGVSWLPFPWRWGYGWPY